MWEFIFGYVIGQSSRAKSDGFGLSAAVGAALAGLFAGMLLLIANAGIEVLGFPSWLLKIVIALFCFGAFGAVLEYARFDKEAGTRKLKYLGMALIIGIGMLAVPGLTGVPTETVSSDPAAQYVERIVNFARVVPLFMLPITALLAAIVCLHRKSSGEFYPGGINNIGGGRSQARR